MARPRLIITIATLAGAAMVAGTLAVALPAQAATGVTATFSKDSDWGTGYQAKYTITNGSAADITTWTVAFDLPAGLTMGSYWDTLITTNGQHVTAKDRGYNATIAKGASVSFGFLVNGGSGAPTNCTVNGGSCGGGGGGGGDTTKPSTPANLHSTGSTSSSVSLAWNASTDNVGVTGYDVLQGGTVATTVTGTSATVDGLAASTTYSFAVRARDAAGNVSANSATVSVTTAARGGGGGGGGGATLSVAPYIDMGAWPTPLLSDLRSASGVKSYTMAFIIAVGCKASWFNAYDPRSGWQLDQVNAIRSGGGDVKISFGGASGQELAQACTDVNALTAEYQAVISTYKLKYIDFDIEGAAVADVAANDRRSQAIKRLVGANPGPKGSLTPPVLPEGPDQYGQQVIRSAKAAGDTIDVVNVMAMDYYRAGDYGAFAQQAATSTHNQVMSTFGVSDTAAWRMVGVTPMLGQNDDGHIFNQGAAKNLVVFARSHHLGELAFWEVTRDRNACNGALYQCTNLPQQPYEFSKIFNGYTG